MQVQPLDEPGQSFARFVGCSRLHRADGSCRAATDDVWPCACAAWVSASRATPLRPSYVIQPDLVDHGRPPERPAGRFSVMPWWVWLALTLGVLSAIAGVVLNVVILLQAPPHVRTFPTRVSLHAGTTYQPGGGGALRSRGTWAPGPWG